MTALATNQETLAAVLFDPLACVPAAIADVDLRMRPDLRHAGIGAFLIRALAARYLGRSQYGRRLPSAHSRYGD